MILKYWQYRMYVSNILFFVSKCRWCFQTTMFPMYVSIYIEPQKLYCCRYFENYCILLGQLGYLGGAIFMPFMINFWWSCPTNLKNEFSKNFFFTWFSSPKIAPKKIPTENYRKFSLISMLFLRDHIFRKGFLLGWKSSYTPIASHQLILASFFLFGVGTICTEQSLSIFLVDLRLESSIGESFCFESCLPIRSQRRREMYKN